LETTGQLLSPQRLTKGQMLFYLCYPGNLLVAKQQKTNTTSPMVCFFYYEAGVEFCDEFRGNKLYPCILEGLLSQK